MKNGAENIIHRSVTLLQLQSTSQAFLTLHSIPVKQINTGYPVLQAEKKEQKT